ncbi:hypothetical protein [Altererythrobacter aquiaggeris]|uniref:hypothetical protein n=1 Tax=Aestuarierythrobacter aquiaggeris TaxID=1898396 RepID=UPI003016503C
MDDIRIIKPQSGDGFRLAKDQSLAVDDTYVEQPGDRTRFTAESDLMVGLASCSAPLSNIGAFKQIHYSISDGPEA